MVKLLGLGDNTVDTYVDQGLQFPGGNAVNVAVLSARLGAEAGYLGCLGGDEAGDILHAALTAEKIDLTRCRRRAGDNARARIGHRNGDRYFIGSHPGVRADYRWEPADFAYIAGFDLTHTSIYSELDEPTLAKIKAAAPRLSFDFSERWTDAILARDLPPLDIAFLSSPKMNDAECEALLRASAAKGPEIVVITRGERGAIAIGHGRIIAQPIVPADVVDTLGAGDGFIAGFLVKSLSGAPLEQALRAGAEYAAEVCGQQGAFGHGRPWSASESATSVARS
ncbi:PfkB family carbohydrate kinase [Terrarubrum flagellatum]|uniref:PfkB family carbohydrate kinase n=1 Tax=Terrirubrum flagellatum TaxID=2895980 RepID=UPI003145526A